MPRIPVYERQVGVKQGAPRTDVYEAPGIVDTSRALRGAIDGAVNAVQVESARRDQIALMQYEMDLGDLDTRLMVGDDQSPGALRRVGVNAAGVTASTMTAWESEAERLAPKLLSAEAKLRSRQIRLARQQDNRAKLTAHEYQEGERAEVETTQAALTSFRNAAIADPTSAKANITRGLAALTTRLARTGASPESAALALGEYESGTWRAIIAAQLESDPAAGIATFEANKDRLLGADRIAVQGAVRPHELEAVGKATGDEFWQQTQPDAHFGPTADVGAVQGKLRALAAQFPGTVLTSLARTQAEQDDLIRRGKTKATNSQHVVGTAADYVVPPGQQEAFIASAKAAGFHVIDERKHGGTGPHIHLQLPTRSRASLAPANLSADPGEAIGQREAAALAATDNLPHEEAVQVQQRIRELATRERLALQNTEHARAAARAEITHRYQNTAAKLQAGVAVPLHERPSEAELAAVHGEDEARRMVGELDALAQMAPDVARLATATESEAAKIIARYAPRTDSDNFAFEHKAYEGMRSAWEGARAAREEDPAAFLTQRSPVIAQGAAAFAQAQQAAANASPEERAAAVAAMQAKGEQYATLLLGEQARLGIPYAKRALLPASVVAQVRDTFDGKLAQGDVAGAVNTLRAAVLPFGDAGAYLLPQLGEDAGPIARFALEGLDLRTIETFAAATRDGEKVLKEAVGDQWKPLTDAVTAELAAFDATGSTEYGAYRDATVRIAAAKVRAGLDVNTAAAQAASETINGRYAFGGNGRVDFRVPRADLRGRPINTDAVIDGAARTLATLRPQDIGITDPVPVGVKVDEFKAFRLRRIQRTGRWLNDGDETGLILGWQDDAGRRVVARGADGKVIRRTWAELAQAPRTSRDDLVREVTMHYEGVR